MSMNLFFYLELLIGIEKKGSLTLEELQTKFPTEVKMNLILFAFKKRKYKISNSTAFQMKENGYRVHYKKLVLQDTLQLISAKKTGGRSVYLCSKGRIVGGLRSYILKA